MPLSESKFLNSLVKNISTDLDDPKYNLVIVLGYSFGGAIVNRVAEILGETSENSPNISKLNMATFGSIYISSTINTSKINIINYLSSRDVAIKCNKIVPISFDKMNIELMMNKKIVCRMPQEDKSSKTKQICLYKYGKSSPEGRPLCLDKPRENSLGKPGSVSILNWQEHNYYGGLTNVIFKNLLRNKLNMRDANIVNVYESRKYDKTQSPYRDEDYPYLEEITNNTNNTNNTLETMSLSSDSLESNSSHEKDELNNNTLTAGSFRKYKKTNKFKKSIKSNKTKKYKKNMKVKKYTKKHSNRIKR